MPLNAALRTLLALDQTTPIPPRPAPPRLAAQLLEQTDWASSALGPQEQWPSGLRFAIDLILQSPAPMVLLCGPRGVMIYNDGYAVIAGSRHPRVFGMCAEIAFPEIAPFNRNVLDVVFGQGKTLSYQDQQLELWRNGAPEQVWLNIDYSPVLDEHRQPIAVLCVLAETTSRHRAEQQRQQIERAWREASERIEMALNAGAVLATWIWLVPEDKVIGDERFARVFQVDPLRTSTGLPISVFTDAIHPSDLAHVQAQITQAMQTGLPYRCEYRVPAPHGGYRWVEAVGRCELAPNGAPLRFPGVMVDIDERKQIEAELRALNENLETQIAARIQDRDNIWDHSAELMALISPAGYPRLVNPAWTHALGYAAADLLGHPLTDRVHADDITRVEKALRQLQLGRAQADLETRMLRADGDYALISWAAVPVQDGFYAIGRDISQQRRTEDQLRQAHKMEAIGQLTGGIAHDFNNMLTGIMGSMSMLQRRINQGRLEDTGRFIDAAQGAALRAAALTHRLLAFARRQSLDMKAVDVPGLAVSIEDMLQRTLGEHIALSIEPAADTWPAWTDANQLESALINLAINARDAMPDGGCLRIQTANSALGTELAGHATPGDYVVITVRDTGHGMDARVLAKAFDPFFTTKPLGQGTGLGLSMIYGYMQQARGHIRMNSTPGQGTTVRLFLPRYQYRDEPDTPLERNDAPRGTGETVLVVEDDPAVRMLVLEVLRDLGYGALAAADALNALPILEGEHVLDLLVCDVGLPGMNGRQLADLARQRRPGLKILFISGYAQDAEARAGLLQVGMDMVDKPFSLETLAQRIRALLHSGG